MTSTRPLALWALVFAFTGCGKTASEECREVLPTVAACDRACEEGDADGCDVAAGLTAMLEDMRSPTRMREAAAYARRGCALRLDARCETATRWEEVAVTLEAVEQGLPAEDDDPAARAGAPP